MPHTASRQPKSARGPQRRVQKSAGRIPLSALSLGQWIEAMPASYPATGS
jgi:hypothetical protein